MKKESFLIQEKGIKLSHINFPAMVYLIYIESKGCLTIELVVIQSEYWKESQIAQALWDWAFFVKKKL